MAADIDPPSEGDRDDIELFQRFVATGSRRLRNQLVERHMGLAAHIAKRYARGGSEEDVRQVAMLGLVKAVDRFDPDHGAAFGSFAGRTIEGEIKRYFRDKGWVVRVPRSAKELHLLVRRATDELAAELGRSPNVNEIAERLGVERDDVVRGLAATAASQVGSLDATFNTSTAHGDDAADRSVALSVEETGFGEQLDQQVVADLLERLPEREREILRLRFYHDQSQSEIADAMGISQMHVSRLLRKSFEQMRSWLGPEAELH